MELLKNKISRIFSESSSGTARYFDIFIQFLIILSVVTFTVDTLPNLSPSIEEILDSIEIFTISVFTIEYLLRLYVAERKLKFIFSFYGLIDLIAIAPYFIFAGADMRSLRLFRILRIFKFFRYSRAIDLFKESFKIVKDELMIFGTTAMILLYLSGVGIYYFENDAQPLAFKSVFDGLWWSLSTLTTVGYGDIYPITVGGKFFTFIVLVLGLGIVGVVTGLMASGMNEARRKHSNKN